MPESRQGRHSSPPPPTACRDDDRGFQLYHSDPSGNYGGWKATAIGQNHQAAQNILKADYKDEVTLEEAVQLVIKARALARLRPPPALGGWLALQLAPGLCSTCLTGPARCLQECS